jgi:two-component system, sensor histidine kinase RegB
MNTGALDISLPWFRWVRRAVWTCQLLLLLWAWQGLGIHLQVVWLLVLIGVGFSSDVLAWWWQHRGVSENRLLGLMLFDTALHSGVFALSGGPFNPFTALYLVNIVLAALVLSKTRQWVQLFASMLGFASLFLVEKVAPATWELPNHQELMRLHLTGMWLAFVVAAAFIVSFVQRLLTSLRNREAELTEARRLSAQHEKLAALTTLAAGAAHELATPLGTIAITSHEMLRALDTLAVPDSLRDDAKLVREQVERCRAILQSMSASSGELKGETTTTFSVDTWLDEATADLTGRERVVLPGASPLQVTGPRAALTQALRNLVKNALEASSGPVFLEATHTSRTFTMSVRDRGPAIDANVVSRWGEPFFTTKQVGKGMGLGVFLARTLAQQLGGSLTFHSAPGQGTTASFSLPTLAEQR